MCGLFGAYSGYLSKNELQNVRQLGILSQFRGIDSTGIAVVSKKKNKTRVAIQKDVIDSTNFFLYSKDVDDAMEENHVSIVMGHCRAATHGAVNEHNAHPIQERHITGVHNGTIDKFAPKFDEKETSSDSRVLMRNISFKGLFPTLREAGYQGAWAIVYFDHSNNTLNFIRNNKRPLWLMFNKGRSTVYWASEKRMLDFISAPDNGNYEVPLLIKDDVRIVFQMGNMTPRSEEFKMYEPLVPTPQQRKEENKAQAVPFLQKRAELKARLQAKREEKVAERVASGASVPIVPSPPSASTSVSATATSGTTTTPIDSRLTKPGCTDEECVAEASQDLLPFVPDPAPSKTSSTSTPPPPPTPPKKDVIRAKDFKDLHEYMDAVSKSGSKPSSTLRYRAFGGKIIDIREARKVMEEGCEFCHDPQVPLNNMFWLSHKTFVCSDCLSDDRLLEIYNSSLISKGEILYDN